MAFTKRQMMLIAEVNPASFLFFFEKGNSGTSWSIRDYSIANRVRTYRPADLQHTSDYFFQNARYAFNAPAHDTNDLAFWHKHTVELNQKHGIASTSQHPPLVSTVPQSAPAGTFPVLSLHDLLALPKARKAQDMERILHSANREDWVTWNFFQVLQRRCPSDWWLRICEAARHHKPTLDLPTNGGTIPTAIFWKLARSPEKYQAESRKRMAGSSDPAWVARAASSDPVEGPSEIDVTIECSDFLVFIEAKLGSDISPDVKYDPHRNQIVRNIDCLLDQAGQRQSAFWMLVRDKDQSRAYVQLMDAYKADPSLLARDLPYRSPDSLERICRNLTILLWSDFGELVGRSDNDSNAAAVIRELGHRMFAESHRAPTA